MLGGVKTQGYYAGNSYVKEYSIKYSHESDISSAVSTTEEVGYPVDSGVEAEYRILSLKLDGI